MGTVDYTLAERLTLRPPVEVSDGERPNVIYVDFTLKNEAREAFNTARALNSTTATPEDRAAANFFMTTGAMLLRTQYH